MFSRGNIKEKLRLLDFHSGKSMDGHGLKNRMLSAEEVERSIAVDLYAGIGYFVFSYVGMGCRRVFGWELNPWSVEGLRRGARANGWTIKVVERGEECVLGREKIVIFLEDNQRAGERMRALQAFIDGEVRHVNCGLLPRSTDTWEMGLKILRGEGWLHLHENVGTSAQVVRGQEIQKILTKWLGEEKEERMGVVEHIERVKSFAPGVWHCVFDVHLQRAHSS